MKIISMSQRKFKELIPLELPKEVFNTEAEIYDFRYKGQDKVFKRLYHQSGQVFANKLYTIEMLDNNKEFLPDNFVCPDYLGTVGGIIEGFTLPKIYGVNLSTLLTDKKMDPSTCIFYLKKVGEILTQLKYIRKTTPLNDFYINDLHDSNFIANLEKGQLTVIDLDSSKIGNNESSPSRFLTPVSLLNNVVGKYKIDDEDITISEEERYEYKYREKYKINEDGSLGYVIADENTDIYCYIIMILNYLYGKNLNNVSIEEFYNYMNYLEHIGISRELIEAFCTIVSNKDNENPVNLLDSLTNEQIYRAKSNVYKKVS